MNKQILVLYFNIFLIFLGIGLVIPVLPVYLKDLGLTGSDLGLLVAAFALSQMIISPFGGTLADKLGKKLIICIGLILFSVSEFMFAIGQNFLILMLSRVIGGMSAGMDELRRFNQINHYRDNLMAKLNHFDKLQLKEQRFLTIYDFILNIIAMLSIFGSLVLGLIQINAGQLNIIYMTSIVLMVLTLFEQAVPMTNVAYYKADTDQALHDINEVISVPSTNGKNRLNDKYDATNIYEVKDASFKYWNQQTYVLSDINFNVNRGEKIAIVGPSGSGKSTLLQIMAGLYQLDSGSIRFENMDMFEIDDKDKFKSLNVLLQSQQLFDGTIRQNLFTDEKDEAVQAIFKQLDLEHLALERQIDLDGHTLSGGEIQRLAIARMLLKDTASTWILDEPTTALDKQNSLKVMDLIEAHAETLIVATHDLTLLSRFETIIVMINGKIVEKGNYQQLLANQGALWNMIQYNA
ncbi:Transport ATP-binding protein CydC [Staphylococcus aureus]|nr:Transport ATP-binding protein CydC [Staphylococcus aureus]